VRVLVFTLLFVLGLFAYSQEILKGPAKNHKKLFIYSLRRGDGSVIRIDLVNVNFGTIPTCFGGNAYTVLTINGISFKEVRMQGAP
jgi:hypothetical protein